jgi:hypothetical protein
LAVLAWLAAAAPAVAQGDFVTDFESASTGWTFQQVLDTVKWAIDGTPVVFISPQQTLNNVDNLQGGAAASGTADAYSPTAFFNGTGDRFIDFWCRYDLIPSAGTSGSRRRLKIGRQLLREPALVTFHFNIRDGQAGYDNPGICDNPPGQPGSAPYCTGEPPQAAANIPCSISATEFRIPCEDGWHRHVFEATTVTGSIVHNGTIVPLSGTAASNLRSAAVLQVDFQFKWESCASAAVQGGAILTTQTTGAIAWFIDDLRVTQTLINPFAPDPNPLLPGGGGGGGGGGGCSGGAVPAHTSRTGLPASILGLALLAAGVIQLKRRLA